MPLAGFVITSTAGWLSRTAHTSQRLGGVFLIIHSAISIGALYTNELTASLSGIVGSVAVGAFLALGYVVTVPIALCMVAIGVIRSIVQAFDQLWDPIIFSAFSTPGYLLLLLGKPSRGRLYTGSGLLVIHMFLYAAVVAALLTGEI